MTSTKTHEESLDAQFERLAETHDISVSRLKAVYFRGVDEFLTSEITYGSATMYGLARVQRFINDASKSPDSDLVAKHAYAEDDSSIELSSEMAVFLPDVIFSSGASVNDHFYPGQVTGILVSDDEVVVDGVLGDLTWKYVLETLSGDYKFDVL